MVFVDLKSEKYPVQIKKNGTAILQIVFTRNHPILDVLVYFVATKTCIITTKNAIIYLVISIFFTLHIL